MLKLIGFLAIIGGLGYGGYRVYQRLLASEQSVCEKFADLCGGTMDGERLATCVEGLKKLKDVSGPEKARRAGTCVLESTSCISAAGCLAGASMGAAEEFLGGIKRVMQDK